MPQCVFFSSDRAPQPTRLDGPITGGRVVILPVQTLVDLGNRSIVSIVEAEPGSGKACTGCSSGDATAEEYFSRISFEKFASISKADKFPSNCFAASLGSGRS